MMTFGKKLPVHYNCDKARINENVRESCYNRAYGCNIFYHHPVNITKSLVFVLRYSVLWNHSFVNVSDFLKMSLVYFKKTDGNLTTSK